MMTSNQRTKLIITVLASCSTSFVQPVELGVSLGFAAFTAGVGYFAGNYNKHNTQITTEQSLQEAIEEAKKKIALFRTLYPALTQASNAQTVITAQASKLGQHELDTHSTTLQELYRDLGKLHIKIVALPQVAQSTQEQRQLHAERIAITQELDTFHHQQGILVTTLQEFLNNRSAQLKQLSLLITEAHDLLRTTASYTEKNMIAQIAAVENNQFPLRSYLKRLQQYEQRIRGLRQALHIQPFNDTHVQKAFVLAQSCEQGLLAEIARIQSLPAYHQEHKVFEEYERIQMRLKAEQQRAEAARYSALTLLEREQQKTLAEKARIAQAEAQVRHEINRSTELNELTRHVPCQRTERTLRHNVDELKGTIAELKGKNSRDLAEKGQIIRALNDKLTNIEKELRQLQTALTDRDNNIEKLQSSITDRNRVLSAHEKNVQNLRTTISSLQSSLDKIEEVLKSHQPALKDLEGFPCAELNKNIKQVQETLQNMLIVTRST